MRGLVVISLSQFLAFGFQFCEALGVTPMAIAHAKHRLSTKSSGYRTDGLSIVPAPRETE